MPEGVRLACDVGSARIGIARSDPDGILAVPLDAVSARGEDLGIDAVLTLIGEFEPVEVIVGLPLSLDGSVGPAAERAREWAARLMERTTVPVRLRDERLTTVQAQRGLHEAGRSTRTSRSVIDSASAVILLQAELDALRREGGRG